MPFEVIAGSNDANLEEIVRLQVAWDHQGKQYGNGRVVVEAAMYEIQANLNGETLKSVYVPRIIWELDRAEVNKMIRVLRRARNQAYGRDE